MLKLFFTISVKFLSRAMFIRAPGARCASRPLAGVIEAIVQTMLPALPELDGVDAHPETTPEARQRHLAIGKLLLEFEELGLQHATGRDAGRLFGDPGGDLAILGTAVEILHHLEGAHLLHPTGHVYLSVQGVPGEEQADTGLPSS